MATYGELPAAFGRPIAHSRAGLVVSAATVATLIPLLNLTSLAVIGSLTILFVHIVVHVGHLRLLADTGASVVLVAMAALSNSGVVMAVLSLGFRDAAGSVPRLLAFFAVAVMLEMFFRYIRGRQIEPRSTETTGRMAHNRNSQGNV